MRIQIFLASSGELKAERLHIASLVSKINFLWNSRDINIRLIKWEYLDSSMGAQHKQEDYNDILRECDMAIILFWKKFGKYTEMEFQTALLELKAGNRVKRSFVLIKETEERSDALSDFVGSLALQCAGMFDFYSDILDLKKRFIEQIMLYIKENTTDMQLVSDSESLVTCICKMEINDEKSFNDLLIQFGK